MGSTERKWAEAAKGKNVVCVKTTYLREEAFISLKEAETAKHSEIFENLLTAHSLRGIMVIVFVGGIGLTISGLSENDPEQVVGGVAAIVLALNLRQWAAVAAENVALNRDQLDKIKNLLDTGK